VRKVNRTGVTVAALFLGAGFAIAGKTPQSFTPQPDQNIAREVRHEVVVYSHYTIFDNIEFSVDHGSVVLEGEVTQPYKKSDLTKIVQRIPGVTSVTNNLKVLPLSSMDDRLRMQVARSVYGDANLSTLAYQALPPIHIIVDSGHVTLDGVVNTELQKEVAGMRANSAGLSFGTVTNNLRVENPPAKKN
jgi:hyperosmotically inducible periplasmic protein